MNALHILGATFALVVILYCFLLYNLAVQHLQHVDDFETGMSKANMLRKVSTPLPTVKRRAMSVPHIALKPSYPPIK